MTLGRVSAIDTKGLYPIDPLPMPLILAVAGALLGGALGTYGGVKLGRWLQSTLSDEEREAVATVFKRLGSSRARMSRNFLPRSSDNSQRRLTASRIKLLELFFLSTA